MTNTKVKLVSYITDDNIEQVINIFQEHPNLFNDSLFKYAVRNNSMECLEFLVHKGWFNTSLSNKSIHNTSGDYISVETFKYLTTLPGFNMKKESEKIIVKFIHCGKLHLLPEYVYFLLPNFPNIIDFISDKFKRYNVRESEQKVFLRMLTIDNILL